MFARATNALNEMDGVGYIVLPPSGLLPPLLDRQHLSYSGGKGRNIIRTAACCVVFDSCAQRYAHRYEQLCSVSVRL